MKVLLLVRHGQASFGSDDYDALSDVGHEQSRVLGEALTRRGVVPDVVIRGDLRRHRETVTGLLEGMGGPEVPVAVDQGWDEINFHHILAVHPEEYAPGTDFQAFYEEATGRWASGVADGEYDEPFAGFVARVTGALAAAASLAPENGTALVVTSGGPIGLVVSQLLSGGSDLWIPLNRTAVNSAVTKVINGSRGLNLASYNEHAHLEHDRRLITYR